MHYLCSVNIDLSALQHNLQRVRDYAPHCCIMAMVKANGYGHGLIQTAKALVGADALGVARVSEGIALRRAGVTQPIVLVEGFSRKEELPLLVDLQLTPVLHQAWQVQLLTTTPLTQPIKVWIKITQACIAWVFFQKRQKRSGNS